MHNGKEEVGKKLNIIFTICLAILLFISMTGLPYIILD